MEIYTIKIHSFVDIITNSSTEIFVYSEGALEPLKELINEMLLVFREDMTFDDLFYAEILLANEEIYYEALAENEDIDEESINIGALMTSIIKGEITKPEWMLEAEQSENGDGYELETHLYMIAKDPKHASLASKLLTFLYSLDYAAIYN